jgi:hypothetical protein
MKKGYLYQKRGFINFCGSRGITLRGVHRVIRLKNKLSTPLTISWKSLTFPQINPQGKIIFFILFQEDE